MEDRLQQSLQCSVNQEFGDGTYEVCEPIRRGADGYVYRIQFRANKKQAALKAIPKCDVQWDFNHTEYKKWKHNSQRKKKAKHQIEIQQSLKTQFVVRLKKWFEDEWSYYLIMEYYGKGDLHGFVRKSQGGVLGCSKIQTLGLQLAKGIATLHKEKIAHRDIKPQNILIDDEERVKICDFGCAAKITSQKFKGSVGTLEYMAPQIIKSFDERVDIWSFGVVLYFMGTGKVPFKMDKQELKEITLKINHQAVEQLKFPKELPYSYEHLVRNCLKISPEDRLSLSEIIDHPFFKNKEMKPPSELPKKERIAQSMENLKSSTLLDKQSCLKKESLAEKKEGIYMLNKTVNKQNRGREINSTKASMKEFRKTMDKMYGHESAEEARKIGRDDKGNRADFQKMLLRKKLESRKKTESSIRSNDVLTSPIKCNGLYYNKTIKRQNKTEKIVIDENGYSKTFIDSGKRVQVSPNGHTITVSQGNLKKKLTYEMLKQEDKQKYYKQYRYYSELVKILKVEQGKKKEQKSIRVTFGEQNWIESKNGKVECGIEGVLYRINSPLDLQCIDEKYQTMVRSYYHWLATAPS